MKRLIPVYLSVLLVPAAEAQLYKCTDASGEVAYQDQPCAGSQAQEVRAKERTPPPKSGKPFDPVVLQVPGVGKAVIPVFQNLEHMTRAHGEQAATIAIRASAGEEPFELQMTFLANRAGDSYSSDEADQLLAGIDPVLVPAVSYVGESWTFPTQIGNADFVSARMPKLHLGSSRVDEFDTNTAGHILHPDVVVAIKILNNGGTSESLRTALGIVNAFQVVRETAD